MRLKRIQVDVGVQICGGNLYGIFVESLDDDSPAKSPDGLLPGDLILEVFISGFISDCHVCNKNYSEMDLKQCRNRLLCAFSCTS